jgi:hypothetical protein
MLLLKKESKKKQYMPKVCAYANCEKVISSPTGSRSLYCDEHRKISTLEKAKKWEADNKVERNKYKKNMQREYTASRREIIKMQFDPKDIINKKKILTRY